MTLPAPSIQPRLPAMPGGGALRDFGTLSGLLASQEIRVMAQRRMLLATQDFDEDQIQPSSLDLRLGARAYRMRASFLPGRIRRVEDMLHALAYDEIDLDGKGAVLERGCVYVVPLLEHLDLPESLSASANPKSSTGRLDIFTRLITDGAETFDSIPRGYRGPLYAEISPRSFSVRLRKGLRLNQIRFRRLNSQQFGKIDFAVSDNELRQRHRKLPLVDGELNVRNGLVLRVALSEKTIGRVVGYRAQKNTDVIDVARVGQYAVGDFWETLQARPDGRLILDPGEFYILASQERIHIPPDLAAEMVPIDPAMGEFRVHYAGFFDPGFGHTPAGQPGARGVLEVRSHEVPFILEDGQIIGRLAFEKMAEEPDVLYGATPSSNYQGQDLKLSKHFRM